MVKLVVGNTTFKVTPSYQAGARAYRNGTLAHDNPHPLTDPDHRNWQAGYENEAGLLHVVDGIDLTTAEGHGSRVFTAEYPIDADRFPRAAKLRYSLSLMRASGMLQQAAELLRSRPATTPHVLRATLQQKGHALSLDFAKAVHTRVLLEASMRGEVLSNGERARIETLSPGRRTLLAIMADLQDAYFDARVSNAMLAKKMAKPPSWVNATAATIRRDQLAFLFRFTGQHCTLTPKGWSAARMLAAIQPLSEEAATTACQKKAA